MPCQIRPATHEDRDAIEQLVFGVLEEYGLAPDPNGTDADLRDIQSHYLSLGGTFDVLIDESGRIVGTVGVLPRSPTTCELRKMYLGRSARGQGLGRRLLEHALAQAVQLGFRRMELETASVLREAIGLYERYGFRPYAPKHLVSRCDRAYFLDLRVEKVS
jgi:putative acetyltransferase